MEFHSLFVIICTAALLIALSGLGYLFSPGRISTTFPLVIRFGPSFKRSGSNIIYWRPHTTASNSTLRFLHDVSLRANLVEKEPSALVTFPFQNLVSLNEGAIDFNCTVYATRVQTLSHMEQANGAIAGVVIISTRNSRRYLCSRFWHALGIVYPEDDMDEYQYITSKIAKQWWNYWFTYDACSPMRYYDGTSFCDERISKLKERADVIASRVDCVIDVEDPQPDADAICHKVGIKECPSFLRAKSEANPELGVYEHILKIKHINMTIDRAARVTDVLRDALMYKRCRFLGNRNTLGDLPDPNWPTTECSQLSQM